MYFSSTKARVENDNKTKIQTIYSLKKTNRQVCTFYEYFIYFIFCMYVRGSQCLCFGCSELRSKNFHIILIFICGKANNVPVLILVIISYIVTVKYCNILKCESRILLMFTFFITENILKNVLE